MRPEHLDTHEHLGDLPHPIQLLEDYLRRAGVSILQAAFAHSFFITPEAVHATPVQFPDHARTSKLHYPGRTKGETGEWEGREVKLDDNHHAQMAWQRHSGRKIARGSGFGVRHIWGNPWDPDAFTAGWNLCYMPFWVGMLTESQHEYPELTKAVQQASFDLYFRGKPEFKRPRFVADPGLDLMKHLKKQPILLLSPPA